MIHSSDVDVEKEECINHVGKRLGTGLRTLVDTWKARHVTLGGRGRGRLTQNAIRKLQIYFTRAIHRHSTASDMRDDILSGLRHCFSTDARPDHDSCPKGEDSRCFFQKAKARKLQPESHIVGLSTPLNRELLEKRLMPVYERLTSDDLLARCERKGTQNANECLHSVVWAACSKVFFYSKDRVEYTLLRSISEFNFGPALNSTIEAMYGVKSTAHSLNLQSGRARKRLYNDNRRMEDKENKRKDVVKAAKQRKAAALLNKDGPAYKSGAAPLTARKKNVSATKLKPPAVKPPTAKLPAAKRPAAKRPAAKRPAQKVAPPLNPQKKMKKARKHSF